MKDKISVIIPVYNVEQYLARCLDSIIENTYKNLEIICVNDGSADNCGEVLSEYAERDKRIVVITQKNGGLSAARNRGIENATGEFVVFIDSDDWIHPQFFEILIHMQKKCDYDLICCGFKKTVEQETYIEYNTAQVDGVKLDLAGIYQRFSPKTMVWAKIYRRTAIANNRFIEQRNFPEDVAFNATILKDCPDIRACEISLPLYYYFTRPGSLVSQLPRGFDFDLAKLFYKYACNSNDETVKYVFLLEGLKRCSSARMELAQIPENKEIVRACDAQIKQLVRALRLISGVPMMEKMKYLVLGMCPYLFNLYMMVKKRTFFKR